MDVGKGREQERRLCVLARDTNILPTRPGEELNRFFTLLSGCTVNGFLDLLEMFTQNSLFKDKLSCFDCIMDNNG